MKKKIGVFVDSFKEAGGAFQEAKYTLNLLKKSLLNDYEILVITPDIRIEKELAFLNLPSKLIKMGRIERYAIFLKNFSGFFRRVFNFSLFKNLIKNSFEIFLKKNNIFFVYFLGPSSYSLYLSNTNYALTVPDLAHISSNEFPEVSGDGELNRKKEIFENSLPKAFVTITNCTFLKNQINVFYKIPKEKILIQPHLPSLNLQNFNFEENLNLKTKKKFDLPKKYIFYPAQYWTHKNHKILINVIDNLKFEGVNIDLVTCGSDKGILDYLKKYTQNKKLEKNVKFLGFVDDGELPYLYKNSLALVMPTFIGPTNIPPWEAFILGVPVIYSNLEGAKEIYKDAVMYVNPNQENSICSAIKKINENFDLRKKLIANGKKLLEENLKQNELIELKEKIYHLKNNVLLDDFKNT